MAPAVIPPGSRKAGVLLHPTSLPSPHGIGDLGRAAFAWIDALASAGQGFWQVLPLSPAGFADSPYQPVSSFAISPLLTSLTLLVEDGLLTPRDLRGASFPADRVDYKRVIPFKERALRLAWANFRAGAGRRLRPEFEKFRSQHAAWLEDFALFMALKTKHGGGAYHDWPAELVRREPEAMVQARKGLAAEVDRYRFQQFLVRRQWLRLRKYAHRRGVGLIGDLPIFVAADSADVWSHPELFLLDERRRPSVVAGVPPDYFSKTGQLWGNPHYNWSVHRRTRYAWWTQRVRHMLALVDALRIDHFRGFVAAWHVPAGSPTAEKGKWRRGPGEELFHRIRRSAGALPLIAEDLGMITPPVLRLRDKLRLPGMRVLQFAFDGNPRNPFLPEHYVANTVVYTGTHDNDTTRSWYMKLPKKRQRTLWNHFDRPPGEADDVAWELIRLALSSKAGLAIVPLQDVLNLGSEARMNTPAVVEGNWRWRFTADMPLGAAFDRLGVLTRRFRRAPGTKNVPARRKHE
jgi:4-alpha-glucanotransferase